MCKLKIKSDFIDFRNFPKFDDTYTHLLGVLFVDHTLRPESL